MRITHIISTLDPAHGGPPVICASIAAAQAKLGHDVTIATHPAPEREAEVKRMLNTLPGHELVKIKPIPQLGGLAKFYGSSAELDAAAKDADVFHLHSVWDAIMRASAASMRKAGKPYVVMLNGMLDPWSLSQKSAKKKIAMLLGYRTMLNRAAFLHCGNRDEVDLIKPLGLTAPTRIVPNGIFLESIETLPARGSFRESRPKLGANPFILFMSRIHVKKGLAYLADAFAIVQKARPDVRLVVAGPDGGEQANFEARIKALGLEEFTDVTGPIYGQQKFGAMQDASVFCLPSHQEGFSMAITESLAIGLPCVVSKGCHYPEVEEAGAGHVTSLDPKEVAAALLDVLSDPSRIETMRENGRRLIRERFTWPKAAEQLVAAYQDVMR